MLPRPVPVHRAFSTDLDRLKKLALLAAITFGAFSGLGLATFDYAEGTSYFSTDAAACANCHIMQSQYDSWQKSSHHGAAACIDCHLPADFLGKYIAKAENGWHHSKAFTLQDFPEPIRITPKNARILQANCERCHADLVHAQMNGREGEDEFRCVHCHVDVGHGPQAGLGAPWSPSEAQTETP